MQVRPGGKLISSDTLSVDFVLYREDLDLCWRINLAGYRVAYTPTACVYHYGSYTFGNLRNSLRFFYMHRDNFYLLLKYQSARKLLSILPTRCLFELFNVPYALWKNRSSEAFSIIKGMASALRNLPMILSKRKIIRAFSGTDQPNLRIYPRFVVVDYFLLGKKTYKELYAADKRSS